MRSEGECKPNVSTLLISSSLARLFAPSLSLYLFAGSLLQAHIFVGNVPSTAFAAGMQLQSLGGQVFTMQCANAGSSDSGSGFSIRTDDSEPTVNLMSDSDDSASQSRRRSSSVASAFTFGGARILQTDILTKNAIIVSTARESGDETERDERGVDSS